MKRLLSLFVSLSIISGTFTAFAEGDAVVTAESEAVVSDTAENTVLSPSEEITLTAEDEEPLGDASLFDTIIGEVGGTEEGGTEEGGTSDSCGDGLTWSTEGDTTTISGTGIINTYFQYNKSLNKLVIGDDVTGISDTAFKLSSVQSVVIGKGVTSIGNRAFNCSSLMYAYIPSNVTFIGENAFAETNQLIIAGSTGSYAQTYAEENGITFIDENNQTISGVCDDSDVSWSLDVQSGTLTLSGNGETPDFDWYGTNCGWYEYRFHIKSVIISKGITGVYGYAFGECSNLTEITVAETVEAFGYSALPSGQKITVKGYTNSYIEDWVTDCNSGTTTPRYTFESLGEMPVDEIYVTNSSELQEAIDSLKSGAKHKKVILADGIYITEDSIQLYDVYNVTFAAENPGKAEILSLDGYNAVISLQDCEKIKLSGLILGHFSLEYRSGCGNTAYSSGYVIYARGIDSLTIDQCDMYGCGTMGICFTEGINLSVTNSIIRDCSENILWQFEGYNSNGSVYENCIFSGNAYDSSFASSRPAVNVTISNEEAETVFKNCIFVNNMSTAREDEGAPVSYTECIFEDNVWDGLSPKNYGICLNGITWQIVESGSDTILKLGYPLTLTDNTIESKTGAVLPYSESSIPWKGYDYTEVDCAEGVTYDDTVAKGVCGDDISWTFAKNTGTLTLTGTGEMYSFRNVLWKTYSDEITNIVIDDRITVTNSYMFQSTPFYQNGINNADGAFYSGNHLIMLKSGISGEFEVKEGTVSLPYYAFYYNNFTKVTLPEGISVIPEYAFSSGIQKVVIPSTVTKISDSVFTSSYLENLSEITFNGTKAQWESIDIGEDNGRLEYVTIRGKDFTIAPITVSYDKVYIDEDTYEITITGCEDGVTDLVIPDTIQGYPVTKINDRAFCTNTEIQSVSLPDTLTYIGQYAFSGTAFYNNSENWSDNILYIGKYLIYRKPSTASTGGDSSSASSGGSSSGVSPSTSSSSSSSSSSSGGGGGSSSASSGGSDSYLDDEITESGTSSLTTVTVKDDTVLIAAGAFAYNRDVKEIILPENLKLINDSAFMSCINLTSISFPENVTINGFNILKNCSSLKEVSMPASYNQYDASNGTDYLYKDFENCSSLENININENNTAYASVDGVVYSNDKTKLMLVPAGKRGSFTVDSKATTLRTNAFSNNILDEVILPEGMTEIPYKGFSNSHLGTVYIPSTVSYVNNEAFYLTTFEELKVSEDNRYFSVINNALYDKNGKTLKHAFTRTEDIFTVPDGTETLNSYCLYYSDIEGVIIPKSVTAIYNSAFKTYWGITDIYYEGTQEEWESNGLGANLYNLSSVNMHYSYSVTTPETYSLSEPVQKDDNISVTVKSDTQTEGTHSVIIALYDADGKFTGFKKEDVSYSEDDQTITFTDIDSPAGKAKIFVWNSTDYMRPASEAVSIEIN